MIPFDIGLTDHLEGPRDRPSPEVFDDVSDLMPVRDSLTRLTAAVRPGRR